MPRIMRTTRLPIALTCLGARGLPPYPVASPLLLCRAYGWLQLNRRVASRAVAGRWQTALAPVPVPTRRRSAHHQTHAPH